MANLKEIRAKVASIKSTQKITRAMQMVAASKMRRAQERMAQGRPYAENMHRVIAHLVQANPEYKHRYMVERPVKRVGYIIVSSDRGLAGGLNINLFKKVVKHVQQQREQSIEVQFALIGQKAVSFFKSYGGQVLGATTNVGDTPSLEQLSGSVQVMLDAYDKGELDRIYLVSNGFVNAMTQNQKVEQLVHFLCGGPCVLHPLWACCRLSRLPGCDRFPRNFSSSQHSIYFLTSSGAPRGRL